MVGLLDRKNSKFRTYFPRNEQRLAISLRPTQTIRNFNSGQKPTNGPRPTVYTQNSRKLFEKKIGWAFLGARVSPHQKLVRCAEFKIFLTGTTILLASTLLDEE